MLANVVMTPDVGCYGRLQAGCYETAPGNTGRGGLGDTRKLKPVNQASCNFAAKFKY